jgi:hypothetical protein
MAHQQIVRLQGFPRMAQTLSWVHCPDAVESAAGFSGDFGLRAKIVV